MDLEELSKSQIILLTCLVSFVTSIATGVVTVSLMGKAPPAVAETVNRVIQQTIQKVEPAATAAAVLASPQKTIVIRESDLVAQAVQDMKPSIVRLYSRDPDAPQFLGLGTVLEADGTIMTDLAALGESQEVVVKLASGASVDAFVTSRSSKTGIAYLAASSTTASTKSLTWTPAHIASVQPGLGDTVVTLGGESTTRISVGLVTSLPTSSDLSPGTLETDVSPDTIMFGSPLIDENGDVVGVSTQASRATASRDFISLFTSSVLAATSTKEKAPSTQ